MDITLEPINETRIDTVLPHELTETYYDDIINAAERADKLVAALNKMMRAAIKITTYMDWVIIGGKPYLQESGATKVARLFGISWRILDVTRELDEGYPSFTYKMEFTMGKTRIEAEGARSGKDEFFAGKDKSKSPDQIDANDVKKAAYTNCLNNGIKRILPGLRNIDIATLAECGLNTKDMAGYTFKEGSKGGKGSSAENSGIKCDACGEAITQKVASYSEGKYGKKLCLECQKKQEQAKQAKQTRLDDVPYADVPPPWEEAK